LSGALRWRSLDGEWVAYSATTGAMSALDAFNATVLDSVERGGQSTKAIAESLARDAELPNDPALAAKVAQVLDQLVAVGLLTTVAE
jgi:PqqD family protein of HPr-rel-A system